MQLGIVGLGRKGANMALRLIKAGHDVHVYSARAADVQAMTAKGANGSDSLETLVDGLATPRLLFRDCYFMFELLVPMTHVQSDRLNGDARVYDCDLRPTLMIGAIKQLQQAGVEPDVWKVEGLDRRGDCGALVNVARRDGRGKVGCIVLGRGSDDLRVHTWLGTAAAVPGFIGFAIGRTSFWDALVGLRDRTLSRDAAVAHIAARYAEWIQVFIVAGAG